MKIKACMAFALAGAFSISVAVATTLQRLSLADIAQRASVAVVGEVTASRIQQMVDGPYTLTTVAVRESLWGTQQTSLTVATPGGAQANSKFRVGTVMAGVPVLLRGERAIFLLIPDQTHGGYAIVGFDQGMLPLLKTPQGDAVMLPGTDRATALAAAGRKIRDLRTRNGDQLAR